MNSAQGKSILNSLASAVLLKQSTGSVDTVKEYFRLSEGAKEFLLRAAPGQAILNFGGRIASVEVGLMDYEMPYMLTGHYRKEW